jgi:hypothetical protein
MVTLVISITSISVVAAVTSVSVATVYILATMVTKLPLFFGCYNYVNLPEGTVKQHYTHS